MGSDIETTFCIYCKANISDKKELLYHNTCKESFDKFQIHQSLTQDSYKNLVNVLEDFIDNAEYCKNAYFWAPRGSASSRSYLEQKYSRETRTIYFQEDKYEFSSTMTMSARNAYFKTSIYKNSVHTNIRVLKTILSKIRLGI